MAKIKVIEMRFREFQSDWRAEKRENGKDARLMLILKPWDHIQESDYITISMWEYDHVLRRLTCEIAGGGKLEIPIRCIRTTVGCDPW